MFTSKRIDLKDILSVSLSLSSHTHMSREPPAGSLPSKHTHTHLLDRLQGFVELADWGASGRLIPPPQESEPVLHVFGPAEKRTEE